uniref:Uncharacterized protein n=1 Tax=Candidatus Kentrum sp. FW TaxID=2126338 RepID=A0A450RU19_9GAMM|nr:MAG: hypothetical protein BECKFW1821A_GA0114235_100238 [Candidatus Kentron sp. FW]
MNENKAQIEIEDKKRIAISDFERLLEKGSVGFYNSCEITQVFLHDKPSKTASNFYTLACFSERSVSSIEGRFLSKKLHSVNKTKSMGTIQFTVPIDEAESFFNHAQDGEFQIGDKKSRLSDNFVLLPKQFVPHLWGSAEPVINKILKPNFYGSSYIIEFFDEEESVVSDLGRVEIEKVFQFIKDCTDTSIDLSSVYDRVGGLIFQFPITVLICGCRLLESANSIQLNFQRHPELKDGTTLSIVCKTSQDDVVTGFRVLVINPKDGNIDIEIGDSDNLELFVSLSNSDILMHHTKLHFLREISINNYMSLAHAEPRKILTSDSNNPVELSIAAPSPMQIGRRREKEYRDHIRWRTQENKIITNSGDYLVLQPGERKEALTFIRRKLRSVSEMEEICLWDPYLNTQDIIDTLYFETTGVPFRCITSLKGLKKLIQLESADVPDKRTPVTFEKIKQNQTNSVRCLSNNLGVQIEFRCQHSRYGYPFHDRFLILVPHDEKALPIVYSLGASVNSLGKLHHLIQKVTNPRVILRNFNSLWNNLSPKQCRVFLLPDDLRSLK